MTAEPETPRPPWHRRRSVRVSLLVVVAALLLLALIRWVGWDETVHAFRQTGWPAFLLLAPFVWVPLAGQTGAWLLLSRAAGRPLGLRVIFPAVTVGMAVNILTPSAYLGSEPTKVVYAARRTGRPYGEVAGTVVLMKYLEVIAFVVLFTIAAPVAIFTLGGRFGGGGGGVVLVVFAGALAALSVLLWISLVRGWHPLATALRVVRRCRPGSRRLARFWRSTREMEGRITEVFAGNRKSVLGGIASYLVSHTGIFLRPYVFFRVGAGIEPGVAELCLLYVSGQALLAFQLAPGGMGTFDGGMMGVFALVGVAPALGLAYVLCCRAWDATMAGAGVVFGLRAGAGFFSGGTPPGTPVSTG